MLIWEYPTTDTTEIRRNANGCAADAELFVRDDRGGSIIVCNSDGAGPLGATAERRLRPLFTGGRYGRAGGDWLFHVGMWTPDDFRDEFIAWYKLEHLPILLECPLWDGCRFVEEEVVDEGCQFYAMHQLADKGALDSVERKRSRATPWFKRFSANSWFDGAFTRTLCRRLPA